MDLLKLLSKLDSSLNSKENIIICGGAAMILAFGSQRQTMDVDVLGPLPLSKALRKAIKQVSQEMELNENWLNDAAKGYRDYLLPEWEKRLVKIDLNFNFLEIYSLSKIDLLTLKLRAGRAKDLLDTETIALTQSEASLILEHLARIEKFDPKSALKIKLLLEEMGYA